MVGLRTARCKRNGVRRHDDARERHCNRCGRWRCCRRCDHQRRGRCRRRWRDRRCNRQSSRSPLTQQSAATQHENTAGAARVRSWFYSLCPNLRSANASSWTGNHPDRPSNRGMGSTTAISFQAADSFLCASRHAIMEKIIVRARGAPVAKPAT
jgi:hypothetical protein